MSRLIDADKIDFNEVFGGQSDFAKDTRDAAQSLIDAQPTVEAVPVVHGEWVNEYINRYGHPCHCCSAFVDALTFSIWLPPQNKAAVCPKL